MHRYRWARVYEASERVASRFRLTGRKQIQSNRLHDNDFFYFHRISILKYLKTSDIILMLKKKKTNVKFSIFIIMYRQY